MIMAVEKELQTFVSSRTGVVGTFDQRCLWKMIFLESLIPDFLGLFSQKNLKWKVLEFFVTFWIGIFSWGVGNPTKTTFAFDLLECPTFRTGLAGCFLAHYVEFYATILGRPLTPGGFRSIGHVSTSSTRVDGLKMSFWIALRIV